MTRTIAYADILHDAEPGGIAFRNASPSEPFDQCGRRHCGGSERVKDQTMGARIGAAVDAAVAKINARRARLVGDRERIDADISDLVQRLAAKKSERANLASQIVCVDRGRRRPAR